MKANIMPQECRKLASRIWRRGIPTNQCITWQVTVAVMLAYSCKLGTLQAESLRVVKHFHIF